MNPTSVFTLVDVLRMCNEETDTYIAHAFIEKMPIGVMNEVIEDWTEQGFDAHIEPDGENVWLIGRR